MVGPDRAAKFRRVIAAKKKKYGFRDRLPTLGERLEEHTQGGDTPQVAIFYRIDGHPTVKRVRVRFKYAEDRWRLSGVTFLET